MMMSGRGQSKPSNAPGRRAITSGRTHLAADILGVHALASGDEGHLLGDDALAGVEHLGGRGISLAAVHPVAAQLGQALTGVEALRM